MDVAPPPQDHGQQLLQLVDFVEREGQQLDTMRQRRRARLERALLAVTLGLSALIAIFVYLPPTYTLTHDFTLLVHQISIIVVIPSLVVVTLCDLLGAITLGNKTRAHERTLADAVELVRETEGRLPMSGMTRAQIRLRLSKIEIYRATMVS